MKVIAFFDSIALISALFAIIILLSCTKKKIDADVKLLLISFLFLSGLYYISLFLEWYGITNHLEFYEDLIGALIPMMVGFVLYSFIQQLNNREIKESKDRLNLALKGSKAGIWDFTLNSDKLIVDERWWNIIGYTAHEFDDKMMTIFRERTHPDDSIHLQGAFDKLIKNNETFFNTEVRIKHKNNAWIWITIQGMVVELDENSTPSRLTGTISDITERKNIEEKLRNEIDKNKIINKKYSIQNKELIASIELIKTINTELTSAKEKAEESDRLKSAFLGNISHEIRTPMNGILGFTELLQNPDLKIEKQKSFIEIIHKSGKRMLSIINDLIDISKIEAGETELNIEKIDLSNLLTEMYEFFEPEAKNKKLFFRVRIPGKLPDNFYSDTTKLSQILINLIKNALKFTPTGGIEVWLNLLPDNVVEFHVKDTGIGIDTDHQKLIFDRFRQVNYASISERDGCGLGLAITKAYAEELNGTIRLISEKEQGSEFIVRIPTAGKNIEDDTNLTQTANTPYSKQAIKTANTILIAEDDQVSYLYLEELLAPIYHTILRAKTGIEAVELCKSHPEIFIVFMDIKMPEMNGYDATREIKKMRPDLPVIIQSAFVMDKDKQQGLSAGGNEFIKKPINRTELKNILLKYSRDLN